MTYWTSGKVGDEFSYEQYQNNGGKLSFDSWKDAGKPRYDIAQPSTYAKGVLSSAFPQGVPVSREEQTAGALQYYYVQQGQYDTYKGTGGTLDYTTWLARGKPSPTVKEIAATEQETAKTRQTVPTETLPLGYKWQLVDGEWEPAYIGGDNPPQKYTREEGQPPTWTDDKGSIWTWDEDKNDYIITGYDPTKDLSQQISPYQQQTLDLQQQQMAQDVAYQQAQQEETKRQYGAQLAAQPKSWLEYAAYTGQPAAVQPWMLPLMPSQYAGTVAGAQLPGWTGSTSMSQLPQLTTPGSQYYARMGPTAQQQWLGYEQARTGVRPEESAFRQWSQSPPGGKSNQLSWMR